MKICYFDAFSGISGDMTVGALCDAGAPFATVQAVLTSLNLGASFRLEKTKRRGIAASKFYVDGGEQKAHRHLPHIEKIIYSAEMGQRVKDDALAVFRKLGEAEAKSHNVPIEKVHFHEVGAVDSICDIVGACVALDALEIEEVYCVADQCREWNCRDRAWHVAGTGAGHGRVTDGKTDLFGRAGNGADHADRRCTASDTSERLWRAPAVRMISQGFGAGDKDFPSQANVLRVLVGRARAQWRSDYGYHARSEHRRFDAAGAGLCHGAASSKRARSTSHSNLFS